MLKAVSWILCIVLIIGIAGYVWNQVNPEGRFIASTPAPPTRFGASASGAQDTATADPRAGLTGQQLADYNLAEAHRVADIRNSRPRAAWAAKWTTSTPMGECMSGVNEAPEGFRNLSEKDALYACRAITGG